MRNPPQVRMIMTKSPEIEDFHMERKKNTLPTSGFSITNEVYVR